MMRKSKYLFLCGLIICLASGALTVFSQTGGLAALVGSWENIKIEDDYTDSTGSILKGKQTSKSYKFSADGTVEHTMTMKMPGDTCVMEMSKNMIGKAKLSGDTLTIEWTKHTMSRAGSCDPAKNFERAMPIETQEFKTTVKTVNKTKTLCLTNVNNSETCLTAAK